MSGGKKTIMPADVFRALDDIEYGFMREKLEAEFASQSFPFLPYPFPPNHTARAPLPLSPSPFISSPRFCK